ncbi:MAG: hypothetical protein GKR91_15020 [Pseudomonadales bacterium]|nr:hypothetical protein [Pseudomonadales bacterium]
MHMNNHAILKIAAVVVLAIIFIFVFPSQAAAQSAASDGVHSLEIAAPHQYTSAFLDTDAYSSQLELSIDSSDVGQIANLFAVALYDNEWFIKSDTGWELWDGATESLVSYASAILDDQTTIDFFQDLELPAGAYQLFAAYQVDGEDLVVSDTPMEFDIQSSQVDRLHQFSSDAAMESFIKEGMQVSSSDELIVRALETFGAIAEDSNSSSATQVSGTNLQIAGVDEADIIKSDGTSLFVLRECGSLNCVATFSLDPASAEAEEVGVYEPGQEQDDVFSTAQSLYLVSEGIDDAEMLVTLSGPSNYLAWFDVWSWGSNKTELEFLNAADPANLSLREKIIIDGDLVSSRRIGETLYVVTRYTPSIPEFNPYATDEESIAENTALLSNAALTDLTPKLTLLNDEERELIVSDRCFLATGDVDTTQSPSLITITSVPLNNPADFSSTCFLGNSETLFMTTDSLYLATTQYEYSVQAVDALFYDPNHKTAIHKFALGSGDIEYRGSGQVEGHLGWAEDKRSFRMGTGGTSNEYLNVVTSVGDTWNETSSTRLTVLRESNGELQEVDFIDGIGKPGEQLYAARFIGDRAYLVTFRVIDPLYVVDLADQENPIIAGELEIEGYSDYLHPISEDLLLGVGKDAIPDDGASDFAFARGAWYQGVKLSLFDISDISAPTEINSLIYGMRGSESEVLYDHHGISFLPATAATPARFAIPIQVHETEPDDSNFDPTSPSAWFSFTNRGLYSFEATEAGLSEVGYIEADSTEEIEFFSFWGSFGDRSLLADDAVFYVHQGEVSSSFFGTSN